MEIELSPEAVEFGRQAQRAIKAAGGDELAGQAGPEKLESLYGPVFAELGAWELDPRGDSDDLEAAAALCRAAGYSAVPYPVAERLARPADLDVDGLVVIPDINPAGAVAGVDLRWAAVTMDGRRGIGLPRPSDTAVANIDVRLVDEDGAGDVALGLVLPCWTLLGMLDRAVELARGHVLLREQFGQPLAEFQGVRFQLTDAEVERLGAQVLAKYALWSVRTGRDDALADALALRLAALEAAETVFRVAHQLFGAIGFCDETLLSWLSRHSQPLRRLPLGLSATRDALTRELGRHGLTGLYRESHA